MAADWEAAGAADKAISVILADSHMLARMGMRTLMEREPAIRVVAEVSSGAALVVEARRVPALAVVLDVDLPGNDLVEVVRTVDVPMLIVGESESYDQVFSLLCAGARGFANKLGPPDELLRAVRAVAAGHGVLTPQLTGQLLRWMTRNTAASPVSFPVAVAGVSVLTRRELEVLRLIAEGLSNEEIATILVLRRSTVKSHVYHLLKKLGLHDRAQAVAYAYHSGVVRPPCFNPRYRLPGRDSALGLRPRSEKFISWHGDDRIAPQ